MSTTPSCNDISIKHFATDRYIHDNWWFQLNKLNQKKKNVHNSLLQRYTAWNFYQILSLTCRFIYKIKLISLTPVPVKRAKTIKKTWVAIFPYCNDISTWNSYQFFRWHTDSYTRINNKSIKLFPVECFKTIKAFSKTPYCNDIWILKLISNFANERHIHIKE